MTQKMAGEKCPRKIFLTHSQHTDKKEKNKNVFAFTYVLHQGFPGGRKW